MSEFFVPSFVLLLEPALDAGLSKADERTIECAAAAAEAAEVAAAYDK